MRKKEQGSVTIEASISLTVFVFLFAAIYSIISFCIIQQKISYAMDTAAKQIAEYAYFYELTGLKQKEEGVYENASAATEAFASINQNISGIKGSIDDFSSGFQEGQLDQMFDAVDQGSKNVEDLSNLIQSQIDDPGKFLSEMFAYCAKEGLNAVKAQALAAPIARSCIVPQFGKDYASANSQLEKLGVKNGLNGLNFGESTLFYDAADGTASDDIVIHVSYMLQLEGLGPFSKEIKMEHTARTRAWLGGDK